MRLAGLRFKVEGTILLVAIIVLCCLDLAYYVPYVENWVGTPKRGMLAWSNFGDPLFSRRDCTFCIAFQNIALLVAVLLSLWAARLFVGRRFGGLIVLVFLVVPAVSLSILPLIHMVRVIMGDRAPNG
jgi:hypothetical protein